MFSITVAGKSHLSILLVALLLCVSARAQGEVEPSASPYGTLGMSSVVSAEPMGSGRLTLQLHGGIYPQDRTYSNPTVPTKNSQVTASTGAIAFGLNPYMDAFASLAAYNIRGSKAGNGSGLGSSTLGLQGSIPVSKDLPVYLGLQLATVLGTSKRQIDANGVDGYDYLETRNYTDILARFSQSMLFLDEEKLGLKIHFNEGLISSFEPGKDVCLLGGIGLEYRPTSPIILGMELNSRILSKKPSSADPLWITPSLMFLTPVHLNIGTGIDISLSKDRTTTTRALEPWRAFGSITFSMDLMAKKRQDEAFKSRQDSLERATLLERMKTAQLKSDQLALMDSLNREQLKTKAYRDSLSLAEMKRLLEEERSRRSDLEKKLLSTGLLILDAVYFETGKTEISINSKPYLNIIAKMLTKYPKLQIEISGHTDNVGAAGVNMNLSQHRAESVVRYMTLVEPSLNNITARGYGFEQPKADNATSEGRMMNRRTELRVLNKSVLNEYNP